MVKNCGGRAASVHFSRSRRRTWFGCTSTASSMAVEREFWPLISKASGVKSSELRNVAESGTGVPRSVNLKSIFTASDFSARTIWWVSSAAGFSGAWGEACANGGIARKNAAGLSPRIILFMLKNLIGCLQAETENIRSVQRQQGKKFTEGLGTSA